MKKSLKVLSGLAALAACITPAITLVSCGDKPEPEPVDDREITIDDSKKLLHLTMKQHSHLFLMLVEQLQVMIH